MITKQCSHCAELLAENQGFCLTNNALREELEVLAAQVEQLRSALDAVDSAWDGEKFHDYEFIPAMKSALAWNSKRAVEHMANEMEAGK